MKQVGWAEWVDDRWMPLVDVIVDENSILGGMKGHHFNLLFHSATGIAFTDQYLTQGEDGDGMLFVSFDIAALMASLPIKQDEKFTLKGKSVDGVKGGYEHDSGVRLFSPYTINKRRRQWAA